MQNIIKKIELLIADFISKQHLFNNFTKWRILKQIECFCQVNEVPVPNSISFAIKVHEIAAKRDGAILDNWDDGMDYISWKKSTNVDDGACMFFDQFLAKKLRGQRDVLEKEEASNRISRKIDPDTQGLQQSLIFG